MTDNVTFLLAWTEGLAAMLFAVWLLVTLQNRRERERLMVVENRLPRLAGLEPRIAEIEVQRRRGPVRQQPLIGRRCLCELALLEQLVGRLELGRRLRGSLT